MKKRNIVKMDADLRDLKDWISIDRFEEVDFREFFRTAASRCVQTEITSDLSGYVFVAFGKKFDNLKSATAYVTEHMLQAMQFLYAWAHMPDDAWLAFCQSLKVDVVIDSDETAQKN